MVEKIIFSSLEKKWFIFFVSLHFKDKRLSLSRFLLSGSSLNMQGYFPQMIQNKQQTSFPYYSRSQKDRGLVRDIHMSVG